MVGDHEAAVHAAPPARAAQLHPAAGEGVRRIRAEALHPRRARGRRRRDHQRARQRRLVERRVGRMEGRRQGHAGGAVDGIQRLDRAMADDRPDRGIHAMQQPLRLAQRIGVEHRRAPRRGIAPPPGVDLREQRRLRRPAIDRQAEGGLGDEGVAAHRLERRAGAVRLQLVVARGHPDPAAMFQPQLRRAQHMAGRMQRQPHAVVHHGLAVGQGLQGDVLAEPAPQDGGAVVVGQVMGMAPARVVAVAVGDHGAVHRPPRVDVEVAGRAVEPLGAGDHQVAPPRPVASGFDAGWPAHVGRC